MVESPTIIERLRSLSSRVAQAPGCGVSKRKGSNLDASAEARS